MPKGLFIFIDLNEKRRYFLRLWIILIKIKLKRSDFKSSETESTGATKKLKCQLDATTRLELKNKNNTTCHALLH